MRIILVGLVVVLTVLAQNPRTREVDELNWMEFKALVPEKINTVLMAIRYGAVTGTRHIIQVK